MHEPLAWAVAGAVAASLAMSAWFALPVLAPRLVLDHSPWAAPAVRAASRIATGDAQDASVLLGGWASAGPERFVQLAPYLAATDPARSLVVAAIAGMPTEEKPPAIEAAVRLLLDDGDPSVRRAAVEALSAVGSIPVLEAHAADQDIGVSSAIAGKLHYLRAERSSLK